MIPRTGMLFALASVAFLLLTSQPVAGSPEPGYVSQLDENGRSVYSALSVFDSSEDAVLSISSEFPGVILHGTEEEARGYAASTVNDALAAKYLSDPYGIWLWDLPVKSVETSADVVSATLSDDAKAYYIVRSVSFQLSAPEKYRDDVPSILKEVKDASETFTGSDESKAKAIAKSLSGISKGADEDAVSDLYDALVKRTSSSSGIAAAYTYLASLNGLESVTVKGSYYGSSDEAKQSCWNAVRVDGKWYAVDASRNLVMAGTGTAIGAATFASAYEPDLDMEDPNGLEPPEINRTAYPYPDETPFLERYGSFILVAIMVAIVVASLYYGIRGGYA